MQYSFLLCTAYVIVTETLDFFIVLPPCFLTYLAPRALLCLLALQSLRHSRLWHWRWWRSFICERERQAVLLICSGLDLSLGVICTFLSAGWSIWSDSWVGLTLICDALSSCPLSQPVLPNAQAVPGRGLSSQNQSQPNPGPQPPAPPCRLC